MDLMKQQQESFACQFIKTRVLDLMKLAKVAKIQIFGLIISDVKEVKNNLTNVVFNNFCFDIKFINLKATLI